MAVNLSPIWGAGAQLLDNSGNVLSGGKIYTYAAGTTTPAITYTSTTGSTANSNPIILNSAGRVPYEIWLTVGTQYKFVLKDSNDTLIGTWDNLEGINSNFVAYTGQTEIQTATAGQTVFTLTTMQYDPNTDNLSVFVDGINQYGPDAQYAFVETNSTTVTFASGLHLGALVKFSTAQMTSVYSNTVLNGTVDPTSIDGNLGDFYINTTSDVIFGPKTVSGWGTGTSIIGPAGPTGATGAAATVTAGTTTTGAAGTSASVVNSGTSSAAIFDFTIPRGDKGDKGDTGNTGTAATVTAGTTTTGAAGTSASVVNSGTSSAAIFDFTIPRGDKGDTGATGATGATGPAGTAATIAVGTTTTGAAGTSASVVNSGTSSAAVFDFTIPKGADGTGIVNSVSVASSNGFAGTSSGGATPALTLSTSVSGIVKGNGTALSAATANTDYLVPALANTAVTGFKTATFNSQTVISTTTGSITVDWTTAQNQKQNEPTGTITYTFTAPPGPCHLQLLIDSDGTSTAQTINWPASVIWLGATWAAVANKKAVINFWYDGTNYYAIGTNQV